MLISIKNRFDLPTKLLVAIVTTNLVVAGITHRDFGLTWDEPLFYQYGDAVRYAYSIPAHLSPGFDIERAYGPSATDHKIYGPAYLLIGGIVRDFLRIFIPENLWSLWRLVNFTFFQVGLVVLYRFSRRWLEGWAALAAIVFMAYQPVLWGMAFINPKDMPFLVLFSFTMAAGMKMVERLALNNENDYPVESRLTEEDRRARWQILQIGMLVFLTACLIFIIWLYSDANDSVIARIITLIYEAPSKSLVRRLIHLFVPINNDIPVENYINIGLTTFYDNQRYLGWAAGVLMLLSGILAMLPFFPRLLTQMELMISNHLKLPAFKLPHSNRTSRVLWQWLLIVFWPAVLLGCLTSIRVLGPLAGLFLVGYFLLRKESRSWWPILMFTILSVFALWFTWPYLWDSPLFRFIEVIRHMANNPQILPVLFDAQVYSSNQLPWYYLPEMMAITLTEPVGILFVTGLGIAIWRSLRRSIDWRSFFWILAWFFIPAFYVLVLKPPMYDGFRHFLFILPPVFIIIGIVFQELFKAVKWKWAALLVIVAISLPGIIGIIKVHPYEYAYYNSYVGGLGGAFRRFETDYWLTCYKELVPQLSGFEKGLRGHPVLYVLRQPTNARYYAPEGLSVERYEPDDPQVEQDDLLLLTTRSNMDILHQPDAPVILQVEKNGAILCVIKQVP